MTVASLSVRALSQGSKALVLSGSGIGGAHSDHLSSCCLLRYEGQSPLPSFSVTCRQNPPITHRLTSGRLGNYTTH